MKINDMGLLDGKTALITGGSRGIGKAIALKFASEGADVAFAYVSNESAAEQTAKELEQFGGRVICFRTDVADSAAANKLVADVLASFGHIDILVNNAGVTRDSLLMRMSDDIWDKVIDTNLKSVFNMCRAVTPAMIAARSGSIINMSSVVGVKGNKGQSNYAASKAGMIGFTKSLAKELGSRGIRVNCIAPGLIESDMTAELPEEAFKSLVADIALRRAGKAEEVAGVALFLASGLASYVSGEVIGCHGCMKG